MPPTEPRAPFSPAATAEDPRREKRVSIAVPVKIFLDPSSANFQHACTYDISMIGARLQGGTGIKTIGQEIWIQRLNKRAKYRVNWIGKPDTPEAGQVGVDLLEPDNVIWEGELKAKITQGGGKTDSLPAPSSSNFGRK